MESDTLVDAELLYGRPNATRENHVRRRRLRSFFAMEGVTPTQSLKICKDEERC
jgi:hypothetical protein